MENNLKTRKRICLVIPSLQAGGMERVMSELANYFVEKETLEVHLVLYGIHREIFYPLSNKVIIHKPDFEFNNAKRTWYSIKTLFYLRKTLKRIHPHSVLSFGELWNSFVLLGSLGLKYPIYVSDRCQPDKNLGKLYNFLRKLLYPKAKGIIVQTSKAKDIYKDWFNNVPIHVIGNPIRQICSNGLDKRENIVLSVGRLIKSKNYDKLIEIFASIDIPDWKLIIVGDDAQKQKNRERLQFLINLLKAQDRIELAGQRADVDDFYRRAKIFAFTSSSEGFPNVIGEAMSAGLPVVAYDCVAGPSEMIEHGTTGFLVQLHDEENFKTCLMKLMMDKKLRQTMGENGKRKIQVFSVEHIGQKFEKIILNESTSD
ncbi:MAG: glycosyltransferase family 4 protein [Ignavibacterium sp.]